MIIEKLVTNLNDMNDADIEKRHLEKVLLRSDDLTKRIQRVTTDHGRDVGIRLTDKRDLRVGDVLFMDDENLIVVDITSDDVLVISPRDMHEMGVIAHRLGNRHLPAQFEGSDMIVQYDYLVEDELEKLGIPFVREERKLKEAFRHVGHSHG